VLETEPDQPEPEGGSAGDAETTAAALHVAHLHRQRALLLFSGWRPWQRLVEARRAAAAAADAHWRGTVAPARRAAAFREWRARAVAAADEARAFEAAAAALAMSAAARLALRRGVAALKRHAAAARADHAAAAVLRARALQRRVLTAWRAASEDKLSRIAARVEAAAPAAARLRRRTALRRAWAALRDGVRTSREEALREKERGALRRRADELLGELNSNSNYGGGGGGGGGGDDGAAAASAILGPRVAFTLDTVLRAAAAPSLATGVFIAAMDADADEEAGATLARRLATLAAEADREFDDIAAQFNGTQTGPDRGTNEGSSSGSGSGNTAAGGAGARSKKAAPRAQSQAQPPQSQQRSLHNKLSSGSGERASSGTAESGARSNAGLSGSAGKKAALAPRPQRSPPSDLGPQTLWRSGLQSPSSPHSQSPSSPYSQPPSAVQSMSPASASAFAAVPVLLKGGWARVRGGRGDDDNEDDADAGGSQTAANAAAAAASADDGDDVGDNAAGGAEERMRSDARVAHVGRESEFFFFAPPDPGVTRAIAVAEAPERAPPLAAVYDVSASLRESGALGANGALEGDDDESVYGPPLADEYIPNRQLYRR
jgi:hypothetical protein